VVLPFTGLDGPIDVAVDSAGATAQEVLPFTGLNHPFGMAVDAAGTLYVTDEHNNRVLKLPVQ
jgi:serine/threonine-protein kinase